MHPTLFFSFIHSYGLMLAVGFYAGWWLAARRAKAQGIHPDVVGNIVLISILAGVVGSRLLWFALHRDAGDSIWVLIEVWRGGLVFYGGLIAAVVADYAYLRKKRLPVGLVADLFAPAVALGQAFGRIGCFLNGCCFGGACTGGFPLPVRFPAFLNDTGAPVGSAPFLDHARRGWVADSAGASLAVHPTQLYEAASLFLTSALLIAATPYKRRHGEVFGLLCILNAVSRFGVELVRRDTAPVALGLNPGQIGALAVFSVGVAVFLWARLRGPEAEATAV
ncbi:MAG TPA: prolipoprotein diacylglyceryl transferase [Planctomycetota bacterium]|nr:prolipoprotein diacylglyceryl transferase [Planctomycetota bacterium]